MWEEIEANLSLIGMGYSPAAPAKPFFAFFFGQSGPRLWEEMEEQKGSGCWEGRRMHTRWAV